MSRSSTQHAIVVGGGIGGLLAGRALRGSFERVTILERYAYPPEAGASAPPARPGVPQSRCLHMLLAGGMAACDQLVPGWSQALVSLGAVPFDAAGDALLRYPAGWLPRFASGITTYACSRALLEQALRRCVTEAGVRIREGVKVVELLGSASAVHGVRVEERAGGGVIDADWVVDAGGRASLLPRWLRALGGEEVEETVVESGRQYVSGWFHLPAAEAPDWACIAIAPENGESRRSAMMMRAERDFWSVVLLEAAGRPMPADDEAFLRFTEGLGDGRLRRVLSRARAVSPIYRYGHTSSRIRHYEDVGRWPEGVVAIGDSACALDPYFGLGMTASARAALLLRDHVEGAGGAAGAPSAIAFQRALAEHNREPWSLATGRGLRGEPRGTDTARLRRLYDAAPGNTEIARALLRAQHMVCSMASVLGDARLVGSAS